MLKEIRLHAVTSPSPFHQLQFLFLFLSFLSISFPNINQPLTRVTYNYIISVRQLGSILRRYSRTRHNRPSDPLILRSSDRKSHRNDHCTTEPPPAKACKTNRNLLVVMAAGWGPVMTGIAISSAPTRLHPASLKR